MPYLRNVIPALGDLIHTYIYIYTRIAARSLLRPSDDKPLDPPAVRRIHYIYIYVHMYTQGWPKVVERLRTTDGGRFRKYYMGRKPPGLAWSNLT